MVEEDLAQGMEDSALAPETLGPLALRVGAIINRDQAHGAAVVTQEAEVVDNLEEVAVVVQGDSTTMMRERKLQ